MSGPNGHAQKDRTSTTELPLAKLVPGVVQVSAERIKELVAALEVPFDPAQIEWRVMNTTKGQRPARGQVAQLRALASSEKEPAKPLVLHRSRLRAPEEARGDAPSPRNRIAAEEYPVEMPVAIGLVIEHDSGSPKRRPDPSPHINAWEVSPIESSMESTNRSIVKLS